MKVVNIFSECIANVKWKLLNKDNTRSLKLEKFLHSKQIDLLPTSIVKKYPFLKDFRPQCIAGKMYIRHPFLNRGLNDLFMV